MLRRVQAPSRAASPDAQPPPWRWQWQGARRRAVARRAAGARTRSSASLRSELNMSSSPRRLLSARKRDAVSGAPSAMCICASSEGRGQLPLPPPLLPLLLLRCGRAPPGGALAAR
jgi:hypothetical protein